MMIPLLLVLGIPCLAWADDYTSLQELDGKRIGVQTGSTYDQVTLDSLPNAKISYFNSYTDMVEALLSNKIDAYPADEPVARLIVAENSGLKVLEDPLESFDYGVVLPKTAEGQALKQEFDAWLVQMRESGELQRLTEKWIEGPEEDRTVPDYSSFPAPKGTLTMATEGAYPPMNYYLNGEIVGFEVDLAAAFCESQGYGLKVVTINFDGILPAVQSGKVDFAMAGVSITEERKESLYFSDSYYETGTVMTVRDSEADAAGEGSSSFVGNVRESFFKTFLREDRWKQFVVGVLTTLLITIASIVLGTAAGFGVFMLCRKGGKIPNAISGFCMWLVQGMPMVVLLMILYYVIFGSLSIDGILVSIIGFTLTFGTAVFALLKMGVGAVDSGQREAAAAMGYSDRQTFFKIILPQALPHVIPSFRGEVVSLIKATSIVGYIAVQDLTKVGDIVRSRTYEAFFPLIAVTIIYFALEGLLGFAVSRIQISIDPKRRGRDRILKGVKTDD